MGWGHSALSRVLEVATVAQVKELYLYHHVPEHDDEDIDRMLEQARQRLRASGSSTLCKAAIAEETVILTAS
jgi:ribonuclease BN (tRNA processing enzyme)